MGTRFLCAEECCIHSAYKEKVLKANDRSTTVTGKRLGHPVRSLRTSFTRAYMKAEEGGMAETELEALGAGALRRAVQEGDSENGCFMAGESCALVRKCRSAQEIIHEVVRDGEKLLQGAASWLK